MKKLRLWEILLVSFTFAAVTFIAGYFIGQQSAAGPRGGVTVETERSAPPPEAPAPSASAGAAVVNINTAGKDELATLPGIGEELAARILAYREENGPFRAKDELMDVSGIGEGKFGSLKDLITID